MRPADLNSTWPPRNLTVWEPSMAIIDFSGAAVDYDGLVSGNINHNSQVSFSSGHYSWKTANNFTITALSSAGNVTASGGVPTGGTIDAINAVGTGFEP